MNKSIRLMLLATSLLAALGSVSAKDTQIYTWTDEDGVKHFVDTPPENPNAVTMDAPEAYLPGSADAYPETEEADADGEETPVAEETADADESQVTDESEPDEISYADEKREQMAQKRDERRAAQAERQQLCNSARNRLEILEPSRRVFFTNDQGERERMDDEERMRKVEQAKADIAKHCD